MQVFISGRHANTRNTGTVNDCLRIICLIQTHSSLWHRIWCTRGWFFKTKSHCNTC